MYVAHITAQKCCSFYFCFSVTSLPHQLPDPPGLSDFSEWTSPALACWPQQPRLLRAALDLFVKCYSKAHTATYTAEESWKATWAKWKTLAAFGQWYIFHCMQQLTLPLKPHQKYSASTVLFNNEQNFLKLRKIKHDWTANIYSLKAAIDFEA